MSSTDRLSDMLRVKHTPKKPDPEDRVADALQRALDNTTPERAGVPWESTEEKEVNESRPGWYLPGGE